MTNDEATRDEAFDEVAGQVETVLTYFGDTCSISVRCRDGADVYVQARRSQVSPGSETAELDDTIKIPGWPRGLQPAATPDELDERGGESTPTALELEAVSNAFLPAGSELDEPAHVVMEELGWNRPDGSEHPNFWRTSPADPDSLTTLAFVVTLTLLDVYGARPEDKWEVYPPEFSLVAPSAGPRPPNPPLLGDPGPDDFMDFEAGDYERDLAAQQEHAALSDVADPTEASLDPSPDDSDSGDATRQIPATSGAVESPVLVGVVDRFSQAVQDKVGWYVYVLRDPRDGQVFYVGKGRGNRVFAHAHAALDPRGEPETNLKEQTIRDIHTAGMAVQTEILRHGIPSESQAYTVEAAVMDTCRALGHPRLSNLVAGHHTELGWMSTGVVQSLYDAPPLPAFEEPALLFKIARLWTPTMTAAELFETTRGWWVLGPRAAHAKYAFAVSRGVTRAVYRIDYWRERVSGDRGFIEKTNKPRMGFWGTEAPELADLVGRSTKNLPQGAGAVVIYNNIPTTGDPYAPIFRDADAIARAQDERDAGWT